MSRNIRIKMDGNTTQLVYIGRGINIAAVDYSDGKDYTLTLALAYGVIKHNVRYARRHINESYSDKLAGRGNGYFLALADDRRRNKYKKAMQSKSPVNLTRHVGVEIEFVCEKKREHLAKAMAAAGVADFVHLKSDSSVSGDSDDGHECDGGCRDNCECYYCGNQHTCESYDECVTASRQEFGSRHAVSWEFREDCDECDETEEIDDCDCGDSQVEGETSCLGDHVVCQGHCEGHVCQGSDDHPDFNCNCECDCGGNTDIGHEISVVAKSSQIADIITKVCKVLAANDASVNNTCGLHVHLDMRGFSPTKAFCNLVKAQKLLYAMQPESREDNHFCVPNHSTIRGDHLGRYWGINPASFQEHGTLEIRLHSGSINAEKINNWITLLRKIGYAKKKSVKIDKLNDLTSNFKLSMPMIEYVTDRLNKHSKGRFQYV